MARDQKAYSRAYYLAHREEKLAYQVVYRAAHQAEILEYTRTVGAKSATVRARRLRGWTQERYDEMLSAQEWCCAVCGDEFTATPDADHDHNTMEPRALLCHKCNTGIGYMRDSADIALAAADYLRTWHP